MIKRYKIMADIGESETGFWVQYDDIKNFIPDNRVTEEVFKQFLYSIFCRSTYEQYEKQGLIFAKEKGWIKPE